MRTVVLLPMLTPSPSVTIPRYQPVTQNGDGVPTFHSQMVSLRVSPDATKTFPDDDLRTQTGADLDRPTLAFDTPPESEQFLPTRDETRDRLRQNRSAFIPPRH
ncbi:unnamed protein product [Sphacelaria rigidula]